MRVQELCAQLESDPLKHANNVGLLLVHLDELENQDALEAVTQLEKFFSDASEVTLPTPGDAATPETIYERWLLGSRKLFKQKLLHRLAATEQAADQAAVFEVVLRYVASERLGEFNNELFSDALRLILTSAHSNDALKTLVSNSHYADVRYFTFKTIAKICKELKTPVPETTLHNSQQLIYGLPKSLDACRDAEGRLRSLTGASEAGLAVAAITGFPAQRKRKRAQAVAGTRGYKWADDKEQQKQFSHAWNHFLELPLPQAMLEEVLAKLPTDVLPYLTSPVTLSDFLTHALDAGGVCGLLALHGIFLLMTQHNMDYPDFYPRVYSLYTAELFHRKDRKKLFRLVDTFLKSDLVPAYTVAAFVKRSARLALTLPPSGALVCGTLMHNLIRRHPSCNVLLDRPKRTVETSLTENWRRFDCFDDAAADPRQSYAIESSLWEIEALGNHWCHQVAAHAQILLKDLTVRARSAEEKLENVVSASYSSLIEENLNSLDAALPATQPTASLFEMHSNALF